MEKGSPNNLGAGRLQILLRFSGWENANFVSLAHLRGTKYGILLPGCWPLRNPHGSRLSTTWAPLVDRKPMIGSLWQLSLVFHTNPPSSLRSQANKQLEPRQNTSRHTRDPAPSHVDLLHPDLHLHVALDMAQHSNNRRSSGAAPPLPPVARHQSLASPGRSTAPLEVSPRVHRISYLLLDPTLALPIPSGWVTSCSYRATQMP